MVRHDDAVTSSGSDQVGGACARGGSGFAQVGARARGVWLPCTDRLACVLLLALHAFCLLA